MADPDYSTEIWKPIPGFDECYEASSFGRIRSKDRVIPHWRGGTRRRRGVVMLPKLDRYGYLKIKVARKHTTVHRLVLLAFSGVPLDGQQACHNNGNRLDNRPENLRWGTIRENAADRAAHGNYLIGVAHWKNKLSPEQVIAIRNCDDGLTATAQKYGIAKKTVFDIRRRKIWKHLD